MISKYRILTNKVLNALIQIEQNQTARLEQLREYEGLSLKYDKRAGGKGYYSVSRGKSVDGARTFHYLGSESNDTVRYVKEYRHLKAALKAIGKDIRLLKMVQSRLEDYDSSSIDLRLPETYRQGLLSTNSATDPRAVLWKKESEGLKASYIAVHGVFHPEELNQPTDDGNFILSPEEKKVAAAAILTAEDYDRLVADGKKTRTKTRFPDFSILSEVDYKTVILIEHQGMMGETEYKERFNDRVYDYLRAGYISCINIFYTFDSIDGSVNTNPILDIINLKIRPAVN